jgi:8-oxo-dGTP diphosphatase
MTEGSLMRAAWSIAREALRLLWRRPILGVLAVPLDGAGRVVLVRRSDTRTWALPGGMVEWGERLDQSLGRELLEETGRALLSTGRIVGIYSDPRRDHRMHSVALLVEARVSDQGRGAPNPLEVLEVRAFAPDQLPADLAYDTGRLLDDWRRGGPAVLA